MSIEKSRNEIAKEKVTLKGAFLEQALPSFKDYKIDYNKYLGSGVFGNVYAFVPRPKNEESFWSGWFPYIYGYIYRVNPRPTKHLRSIALKFLSPPFKYFMKIWITRYR